jgi:hypothetical protein
MLIRRTAIWLLTLGALVLWAGRAVAQPAHSGVQYQTPQPTYEHGSAPFSEDNPRGHDISPFKPVGFEPEFDWFAPTETSGYGKGPKPNVGYFFSYERLYWSLSKPESAQIGSPTATGAGVSFPNGVVFNTGEPIGIQGIPTIYTNTIDTSYFTANGAWGNRWEVGYMDTDDYGWMVSVLDHVSQSQYKEHQNAIIQFDDPGNQLEGTDGSFVVLLTPPFITLEFVTEGKIPIRFDRLQVQNIARLNGVEVTRMYRARQLHSGGWFELDYGVRWLQLQDTYTINGLNSFNSLITDPISPSLTSAIFEYFNPLADSRWMTRTQNNMVGPQIGFKLWRQRQKWITSIEARFMAAANFQNVHQMTVLGNNVLPNTAQLFPDGISIPLVFQGIGASSSTFATTFSPVGELRVNTSYQVTRSVGIKVGYTGMVIGGVTRASNRVDYSGPELISILPGNNQQIFWANGINFGVEINR